VDNILKLTVECFCSDRYSDAPSWIEVSIDRAAAVRILEMARIVQNEKLQCVAVLDETSNWLTVNPDGSTIPHEDMIYVDRVTLNVSTDEYWYSGEVRHTHALVLGQRLPIFQLVEFFEIGEGNEETFADVAAGALSVVANWFRDRADDGAMPLQLRDSALSTLKAIKNVIFLVSKRQRDEREIYKL